MENIAYQAGFFSWTVLTKESRTFALLLLKRINDEPNVLSNNFIPNLSRHGQTKLFKLSFVCFDLASQIAPSSSTFLTWYPLSRPRVISSKVIMPSGTLYHVKICHAEKSDIAEFVSGNFIKTGLGTA